MDAFRLWMEARVPTQAHGEHGNSTQEADWMIKTRNLLAVRQALTNAALCWPDSDLSDIIFTCYTNNIL